MEEREKIIEYIEHNFNVNATTMLLIENIYDYLEGRNHSLIKVAFNDKIVKINTFIFDFIDLLNNAYIDITIEEMLENDLLKIEE